MQFQFTFGSLTVLIVTVLLIFLKVTHQIDIGWIWVFGAFWIPLAAFIAFFALIISVAVTILGLAAFASLFVK